MDTQALETVKLTRFSHGGGCGCKIAPKLLSELLATSGVNGLFPNLMVGVETSDDAAVYRLNDQQALIATTDFFMPIVDDAFDFGRIAATNAISDVYAMGGTPILALAIVGMPINMLPVETMQQILAGGASVCQAAGIPIAGGHSIDSPEPIYGLVALGLAHPDRIKRNRDARDGDVLILGKALGVGILSAALKKGELSDAGYAEMIATTTQLNTVGATLATMPGVHALTDVTGFGLLGHTLEMCRGANLTATLEADSLPVLEHALPFARAGYGPGAIERNWTSFGESVNVAAEVPDWQVRLMLDPQTSGGLLVACAPEAAAAVLAVMQVEGFTAASTIGRLKAGAPVIDIVP
ncbi:selenophosphate synthase [Fluviicoccus keumensis]|uniref:Selenide, water dikinase n=1 Tax=Fluviicoccus keumensis TaxID=1435465 RepID=A0A4Q7ZAN6_9GAMM|nr:selenide, water dikinase SelD [Fluviicoccus keumensis]RZU47662.1 selenophosphate synthase [Fluviicoccus keumensis]